MNSTLRKIIIPLILIVLLPAVGYSVFEITSLNETEVMIEEIYENQLEAILNSINQYSDMVVTYWTNTILVALEGNNFDISRPEINEFQRLLSYNQSIVQILLADSITLNDPRILRNNSGMNLDEVRKTLDQNKDKVERLYRYVGEGYRKIEPLEMSNTGEQLLLVVLSNGNKRVLCIFEIDPSLFIDQVLRSAILKTAGEEFSLACFSEKDFHRFNYTDEFDRHDFNVTSQLWLLPDYQIGIVLKGRTLGGLIAERTYTNLILILILNIIIISGVVIVYRNIRKEIELTQIKSDFVSNVSHELRTPLALISMYAETLEMGRVKTDDKKHEYYRIISQESNRLGRIVNTILNFSKIEAGKRKYNRKQTDVNDLIINLYETYNYHLTSRGFNFNINLDETIPEVSIDSEAVSEAIINLIDNAAKYSKDEKFIELKTGIKDSSVFVEVTDKGIGIPKEDQVKIFEKFFRVSTGLVHDTKGTGLGLTIVKHVMDAHNADIEIESRVDKGSTFRILFPRDNGLK